MQIKEALKFFNIKSNDERNANYLSIDSRLIKEESIFIAIDNGVNYIKDLKIKPLIILSNIEREDVIYIKDLKDKLSEFGVYFYRIKEKPIKLIGIVGTNGKTSTANILHQLLPHALLITTISGIKDSLTSENTTPNAIELINDIIYACENNYQYVILEVSSIGIKENRVKGLSFSYLLFLNLSSDHLDYHKTLKDYQDTKINFIINSNAVVIANGDDQISSIIEKSIPVTFFKLKENAIIEKSLSGTIFNYNNQIIKTRLRGYFNVLNLVSALKLLEVMKITISNESILNIKPIKGRMDVVSYSPNIIIDYAHTSVAFKCLLSEVKELTKGRVVIIFGAGGERDKTKRKEYGEIVSQFVDEIILTNDNPRNENELDIIEDIKEGISIPYQIILKREEAIREGIKKLNKEDTLLIVGKGHEDYQIIGNKKYHLSDYEEVKKCL